jgi:hypothetical protein
VSRHRVRRSSIGFYIGKLDENIKEELGLTCRRDASKVSTSVCSKACIASWMSCGGLVDESIMVMAALLILSNALSTLLVIRRDLSSASSGSTRNSTKQQCFLTSVIVSSARLIKSDKIFSISTRNVSIMATNLAHSFQALRLSATVWHTFLHLRGHVYPGAGQPPVSLRYHCGLGLEPLQLSRLSSQKAKPRNKLKSKSKSDPAHIYHQPKVLIKINVQPNYNLLTFFAKAIQYSQNPTKPFPVIKIFRPLPFSTLVIRSE